MKRALPFLVFVLVSAPLTWFWMDQGFRIYGDFLKTIGPGFFDAIGFPEARLGPYRQRYINWIPFAGLLLATPGLAPLRRLGGLAVATPLFILAHLLLNVPASSHRAAQLPLLPSLISDTLPFVLWIVVAWPALSSMFLPGESGPPADADPDPDPKAPST